MSSLVLRTARSHNSKRMGASFLARKNCCLENQPPNLAFAAAVSEPRRFFRSTAANRKKSSSSSSSSSSSVFPTTPDVCDDCADTIRAIDPALGFRNFGGKTSFGGQAVTVKCHEDNSMVKQLAKNGDGTGKVIVVDGGGSKRRALLGDMVASDCVASGWEGLVIYGCIRDVDEVASLEDLGVQALGSHPIPTTKRNEGQIDVPVTFGGVTISPGDWIICDNNGIVVNETDPREKK